MNRIDKTADFRHDTAHNQAVSVLQSVWGYSEFRPGQSEIISSLLKGRDVVAVLPTGGGKSICYQLPALLQRGITLVVSPLISLMNDQVEALKNRGVRALNLSGSLSPERIGHLLENAKLADYQIIYLSPERLHSKVIREWVVGQDVRLLAVDEAHCISEWGHEFRPDYRLIPAIYPLISRPPVLAVTATATLRVRKDIAKNLRIDGAKVFVQGFDRPNLVFSVFRTCGKHQILSDILRAVPGSAIVYAPTRRGVEKWTEVLAQEGHSVSMYHARIEKDQRAIAQNRWQTGASRIMVASNAFGMGIDKPDVRSVTHVGLPASLEAYYQEAGRAGRDGQKAYTSLLFAQEDLEIQDKLRRNSHVATGRSPSFSTHSILLRLNSFLRGKKMLKYAVSTTCRRRHLLAYFGEYSIQDCGRCDVCLGRHRLFVPTMWPDHVYRTLIRHTESGNSPYRAVELKNIPRYRIAEMLEWLGRNGYLMLPDNPVPISGPDFSGQSAGAANSDDQEPDCTRQHI